MKVLAVVVFGAMAISMPADARIERELQRMVGYTIVEALMVEGWQDENGERGDGFEGCEYGRIIKFQGSKALRCAEYGYQYAYGATAIIFERNGTYKMLIEDEVYDMTTY